MFFELGVPCLIKGDVPKNHEEQTKLKLKFSENNVKQR